MCSRHWSRDFPLESVEKTMVRQAVALQNMEFHSRADIHLQSKEDPTLEQVDVSVEGCAPTGSPHWNRLQARPVVLWREEPMLEQVCWQGL